MSLSFSSAAYFSNKISFVSSLACIALLILMAFKPPNVGNYRVCYYILSSLECVSAIAHYFGAPCFYVDGDRFLTFSIHGSMFAHIVWITAYHAFEIMLTACFIFRYATVCRNKILAYIINSSWSIALTYAFLVSAIIVMTCMFYTFYLPSDAIKRKANQVLSQLISIDFEDNFVAGYDYEIGNPYVPLIAFQLSHAFSILISVFFVGTMTVCALLIYHYIKHNSFSSSQTKLHYRVLMLLAQQAVVPFTFVYTLALICAISILIRVNISFMAPIFTLTTSIPPLCSCISVIVLTSEYRHMFVPGRKGVSSTAEESRAKATVAHATTSRVVQY